jgi:hypothetical protein
MRTETATANYSFGLENTAINSGTLGSNSEKSLKNHEFATEAKEWPTQSSPPKTVPKTKKKNKDFYL